MNQYEFDKKEVLILTELVDNKSMLDGCLKVFDHAILYCLRHKIEISELQIVYFQLLNEVMCELCELNLTIEKLKKLN